MTVTSYSEVLKAARRLPLEGQVEVAEALLRMKSKRPLMNC